MSISVKEEENRFVLLDDEKEIGEITWSNAGESLMIADHTYVDPAYREQHLAQNLLDALVNKARSENKKVMPLCPYVKRKFNEDSQYEDVWRK